MPKETVTFRIDAERRAKLDTIAAALHVDRSEVISQALASYVDLYDWQIAHIKEGIAEADRGEFASDEDIEGVVAKYQRSE